MATKKSYTAPTTAKVEVKAEVKTEAPVVSEKPTARPGSFAALISQ